MFTQMGGIRRNDIQVGFILNTNYGYIQVLEIKDSKNVRINFIEYPFETVAASNAIRRGEVKNPMRPTVCGVGFIGVGKHPCRVSGILNPVYQTWADMLKRVYKQRTQDKIRQYAGTSVHSHWHNFQNFADWYHAQIDKFGKVNHNWQLDKDFLIPGNRQYGPDTCCVIPSDVNTLLTDAAFARGSLPIGIRKNGNGFIAHVSANNKQKHSVTYPTIADAQRAYWSEKFRVIQETAIRYWHYLPEPLAYRLLLFNWSDALAYYGDDARIWSE